MTTTNPMTALTPQQMRELADVLAGYHSWRDVRNGSAVLRTAADQLEAVQAVLARAEADNAPHLYPADIEAALTADTAPQEDRDE